MLWAVTGTQLIWFGIDSSTGSRPARDLVAEYTITTVVTAMLWLAALRWLGTRDHRVIGTEATEYKRVLDASLRLFGGLAIGAFLFHFELARGYFLTALPLGLILLFASRWMWRRWLHAQRRAGRYTYKVLIVGSPSSALHLATELARHPDAGYTVVGALVSSEQAAKQLDGFSAPVYSGLDDVLSVVESSGADTVAVTSSDDLPPGKVRQLSWGLEAGRQHIIVAPSLTDIAGPRIHTRPVAGLPLLHVETPRFEGGKVVTKRLFDIVVSGALILVLSGLFLITGLLVKLTSRGPVFYRQQRIGLNGEPFGMLKFRSMRPNADAELAALLEAQGTSDKPLFKVKNDPRITPIGQILRKYSLDELPQLINVFLGDMSLVGPRPQIAGEVALYDNAARRRLLLKPGMSGLWQISGRSSLSWEDAIRLDLYYVENWSITGDVIILWKTVRAVFAPGEDAA